MITFQLFRITASQEQTLFTEPIDRAQLIRELVESKPSAELRRGYVWHIGNVEALDDDGAYFALGRTTQAVMELWDSDAANFVLGEYSESPYTHAFIDFPHQVVAIAGKTRLGPHTKVIAKQMGRLLNAQPRLQEVGASIEVRELNDPQTFLTHLRAASSVERFTAEFSLPNPFDANRDFEQPLQLFLQSLHGKKGKTVIQSDTDLNRDALEEVTRACAAAGNGASASFRDNEDDSLRVRKLGGKSVTCGYDETDPTGKRLAFLEMVRATYFSVRDAQG